MIVIFLLIYLFSKMVDATSIGWHTGQPAHLVLSSIQQVWPGIFKILKVPKCEIFYHFDFRYFYTIKHRVVRMLGYFPVVGIGTPPTPHPQGSVPPPLLGFGGRGTLAGERGGGRVSIPARGHTLWFSVFICNLCNKVSLGGRLWG